MVGVVPTKFRVLNAKQFLEMFSEPAAENIYMFIAKPTAWADDQNPASPDTTEQYLTYDIWRNMLAMKRVQASDVSHVCPRVDWETGDVYDEYKSNDALLSTRSFIVMNESYNVYKCLSNYRGAASTTQPTSTANTAFDTADGYRWKYLFAVSAAKAVKFLSTTYLPVQTLASDDGSLQWDVQQSAANGAIETYDVIAGGTGYLYRTGSLQAGASGTATLDASASGVNDFYNGCGIYIASGTGAGQLRTISDYVGSTKVVTVSPNWTTPPDATSTFVVSPRITVTGDGADAEAYSIVSGGAITRIVPIDSGEDYTEATVTIGGSGSGANVLPMIAPFGGHGSDAVMETSARYVMISTRFSGSESNTFPSDNDFRVVGLVANPRLASNNAVATGSTYDMTTVLTVTGMSGTFQKDETITGGTSDATATVVQVHGTTAMRVTGVSGTFTTETITGGTSGATATISAVNSPDIAPFKGDVIYVDHRSPVTRDANQIETIRIVARF